MITAYDIRIYGRVFNVGFRRYVHRYGLQCNVNGFVENDHDDGCVHIVAEGEETDFWSASPCFAAKAHLIPISPT